MLVNITLYIVRFLHQTTTTLLIRSDCSKLYIVRFLHQTTTIERIITILECCISFVSYIKPQLYCELTQYQNSCISFVSYIKPQHFSCQGFQSWGCISFVSYIKPQPLTRHSHSTSSCISFVSYIKPQPIISNKLYTNILLILFIIKNGCVGFVYIAKILKRLQLNRFADDFFCDFA